MTRAWLLETRHDGLVMVHRRKKNAFVLFTAILMALSLLCANGFAQDAPEDEGPGEAADVEDSEGAESSEAGGEESEEETDGEDATAESNAEEDDQVEKPEGMPEETKDDVPDAPVEAPEGASPEFVDALSGFQSAYGRYAAEIKDYQTTVDSIVESEYARRVAKINAVYDAKIRANEAIEREYRLDAIAAFEEFLEKYPNRKEHTPDAMFRLAELYFEKANDDFLQADEEYQNQLALYDAGKRADPPENPVRDYSKPTALFRKLITDWPEYRHADGAYYLLAYSEQQMGNDEVARDLFAELIVKHPESKFVPESWIRIGEYHFDFNELELAKQAYLEAMNYPDSKFFDKALYKLAWTFYRQDNFDEAIKQFKRLVEYSDEQRQKTGESGSVLRAEAVQYLAISLAEEDWDLDGKKDDDFGIVRVKRYLSGNEPYHQEVLSQLGEYLFENTRYSDAVDIYRFLLQKYPLNRENPELHEKMIVAMLRNDNLDSAFTERGKLSRFYGPGSDWYAYQEKVGNAEAARYARNLVKENLVQSATWHHSQAQKIRNEAEVRQSEDLMARARAKYAEAAQFYEDFIKKYPNDKDIYQWNFFYAECLYYSDQFVPAYEQYRVVREMDVRKNQYQETSAFNAIKALEFRLQSLADRGEVPAKALPGGALDEARQTAESQESAREGADERTEQKRIEAETLPSLVTKYITAMDRYVVLGLVNDQDRYLDAKLAFQAAKIFYDFKHYETARKRFAWIVEKYPENEVAYLAGSLILETYRRENNYEKLAEWAERLSNVIEGEQAAAVREEVREFKLGAMFKSAEKLFAEKKYEKAAAEYVRLLKEDPNNKYAAKALNNAAVAYENVQRFESAMKLYERVYKEHPDNPLAGYALYRVAVNQERFFDFEDAVQSYLLFNDKYEGEPQSRFNETGLDFDLEEKRGDALRSAAVLEENLQNYSAAAPLYERYARKYPENDQAPEAAWQAVLVWEKAGESRKMVDAIERFNREFGSDPEYNERVLNGMMKIADYYEERGSKRRAERQYEEILEEYDSRGIQSGSPAAFYAAKSQFMLAEREFADWREVKIKGSLRRQKKLLQQKIEGQKELTKIYEKVFVYGSLEWTLAAGFRIGNLFQQFAQALYDVPIPFDEMSEQYQIYRTQLEDIAIPLEDEAIKRYEKTIAKAREEKVVNEWTKKTLEELNTYKPNEYPLFKEERREVEFRGVTGRPLLSAEDLEKSDEATPPAAP